MPDFGLSGRAVRMAVHEEDAAETLARIAAGQLNCCVLPWVALMRGGGELAIIEEWKRLADLEPDTRVRLEYGADALIFAELPDIRQVWQQALEGRNVKVSQQILEWQAEARAEAEVATRRAVLLRFLEKRFKVAVPADLVAAIQATDNTTVLQGWLDAVADANSLEEFRTVARVGL